MKKIKVGIKPFIYFLENNSRYGELALLMIKGVEIREHGLQAHTAHSDARIAP